MKNIILLLSIGLLAFSSCKKDEVVEPNTEIIVNNTDFDVEITDPKFSYTVAARETLTIPENQNITRANITTTSTTDKLFDSTPITGGYEINDFNYWFEYRVLGTSKRVTIEYNGYMTTYDTVSLPFTASFTEKPSPSKVMMMEARNNDNTDRNAPIRVECYIKDVLVASDDCTGTYCAAKIYVNY